MFERIGKFVKANSLVNNHLHLGGSLFEKVATKELNLTKFIKFSDFWNELLKEKSQDKIAWNKAAEYSVLLSKLYGTKNICTIQGETILNKYNYDNSFCCFPVMNSKKLSSYLENLTEKYEDFRKNILKLNLVPGIFFHSLYANNKQTLEIVRDLLKKYPNDIFQIHIDEDIETTNKTRQIYGKSSIDVLEEYELLSKNTMIVHGCLLTDDDLKKIAKYNCSIIICPASNLKVGQNIINPIKLNQLNIRWFVSTDGLGTGQSLDLRYQARLLKKIYPKLTYCDLYRSISTSSYEKYSNSFEYYDVPRKLKTHEKIARFLINKKYKEMSVKCKKELNKIKKKLKLFQPTKKHYKEFKL